MPLDFTGADTESCLDGLVIKTVAWALNCIIGRGSPAPFCCVTWP
jgi:hypothetical protein